MARRWALLQIGGLVLALADGWAASPLEHWRAVCEDFRENYSYTEHKGVDWTEIFERNRARFEQPLTPAQFATHLHESLLVLRDWHVAVQKPDGGWLGYNVPFPRNYPSRVATNHAAIPYTNYHSAGALLHARLTNDSVHLIVPTLDTAAFDAIGDADLASLFQSFAQARGLIVDLRYNSGGNELHARRLASFFVREPTLYGYTRTRAPTEPGGFTPPSPRQVMPHAQLRLDLPVVVLVGRNCLSSCEWLALMFREAPNAVLMGDRTRGGTGNPALVAIAELGVNYQRSRWIGYTPELELIEDRGIAPAIGLRAEWSHDDAARRDRLLEHAIAYLDWRHRMGTADTAVQWRTDADADGIRDAAEFVAATDPTDASSRPRLGITGPVPALTWTSAPRRAYAVQEAPAPAGPWIDYSESPIHFPLAGIPIPTFDLRPPGRFFRLAIELGP